jgi:putative oxidoreductase
MKESIMDAISNQALSVIGRALLASLFLLGGLNKLVNYADTLQFMRDAAVEPAAALLPVTVAVEIGCGAMVALGLRGSHFAALILAAFTLTTNIAFHRFWEMGGNEAALQLSLFFKNIAIFGALLFYAAAVKRTASV